MHSRELLEAKYRKPDPFGYQMHPDDQERKDRILEAIRGRYRRALDIGAGEGWITGDLPADEIEAVEVSDNAASRFPDNVKRVEAPAGLYDLVLATGVLYRTYAVSLFHQWILRHASGLIVTCNIMDSEVPLPLPPKVEQFFPYRGRTQRLAIYRV